jgi:uncharacterized membrane protein (DUF2068 family)
VNAAAPFGGLNRDVESASRTFADALPSNDACGMFSSSIAPQQASWGRTGDSGRAMTGATDPPRSRRVLRLIALERAGRGLLLLAAGVYLLFHLNSDFGRLGERVMRAIELDPRRPFFHRIVAYLHHLHASELRVAAIVAIGYGVLELVEGTGLWLDQLWAEYLTVIATSLLLPAELYELVHRPSVWKAAGIVVNLGIVAYLAYLLRRRVRGRRMLKPKTASEALDEVSP